jgi:hypothetical protein
VRAAALAVLLLASAATAEPERLDVDVPSRLMLEDGRGILVPPGSLILWPSERAAVEARVADLQSQRTRLAAENASLRKQAGDGISWRATLVLVGLAAVSGVAIGYVTAQ